jgi:caspase domain-containing protein
MNKKALVVGIDNYPTKPLSGCVNDARAVAQLFARHGTGDPNFEVELITAPAPNPDGSIPQPADPETESSPKDGIPKTLLRHKIRDLFMEGDPDIALFYFSGHGMISSIGGIILTSDFQNWDEGVMMDEILGYAHQSKAKEKIFILDCCHSGAFGTPGTDGKNVCELSEGMVVLSAALPAQQAIEEKGHGIFTSLLCEAMNGAAADLLGQVTPGAIYHYVDQALGSWEQRPIFKTNVTSWTPLRNVPPGPGSPAIARETLRKIVNYFPDPEQELKLAPDYEFTNPEHDDKKVAIFKDLQTLSGVDLVIPVGEEHMYWAAMNSRSCKLTPFGKRYWRLVKHNRV